MTSAVELEYQRFLHSETFADGVLEKVLKQRSQLRSRITCKAKSMLSMKTPRLIRATKYLHHQVYSPVAINIGCHELSRMAVFAAAMASFAFVISSGVL